MPKFAEVRGMDKHHALKTQMSLTVLVLKAPLTIYLDLSIHHASQKHKKPNFVISH